MTSTYTITITSTITRTFTPSFTATQTQTIANVTLQFKSLDNNEYTDSPHPQFRVYNNGRVPLDLSRVAELFFDFVSKTRRSCVQLPALRLTLS
jgi:hypothetical protein